MTRSEVEQGQAELRKQLDGLKLEVNRRNWFLERENMSNPQDKAGIFGAGDVGTSSSAEGATRGQRGPDLPPHAYGMTPLILSVESTVGRISRTTMGSAIVWDMAVILSSSFPYPVVRIRSCGVLNVRTTSICINWSLPYGCAWPLCTWKDQQHVGFNQLNANSSRPVGMSFAGWFMTALEGINMKPLFLNYFISVRVGLWLIMLRVFRF
jgi:hypothetical protein